MDRFIFYLIESSVVLVCLYGLYSLFLKKETFFMFNRFFLIIILLMSIFIPLISFDLNPSESSLIRQPIKEISNARISYFNLMEEFSLLELQDSSNATNELPHVGSASSTIHWFSILTKTLLGIYFIGLTICLIIVVVQDLQGMALRTGCQHVAHI